LQFSSYTSSSHPIKLSPYQALTVSSSHRIKLSPYQALTEIGEALFGEKYSKDMMAIVKAAMPVPSNSKHEQFALAKV